MITIDKYMFLVNSINKLTAELNESSNIWLCLEDICYDGGNIYFKKGNKYLKIFNCDRLILTDEFGNDHAINEELYKHFTIFETI